MYSAPWARFRIPITPKINDRPDASRNSRAPNEIPFRRLTTSASMSIGPLLLQSVAHAAIGPVVSE